MQSKPISNKTCLGKERRTYSWRSSSHSQYFELYWLSIASAFVLMFFTHNTTMLLLPDHNPIISHLNNRGQRQLYCSSNDNVDYLLHSILLKTYLFSVKLSKVASYTFIPAEMNKLKAKRRLQRCRWKREALL